MLNKNEEWKQLNELFISSDEQFKIELSRHLHEEFYQIESCFGIPKLSEDKFDLKIEPELLTPKYRTK